MDVSREAGDVGRKAGDKRVKGGKGMAREYRDGRNRGGREGM